MASSTGKMSLSKDYETRAYTEFLKRICAVTGDILIKQEHHSNLVILSDGLKACIGSIHSNALMAESEAAKVLSSENTSLTEILRPPFYKSSQRYSELNFLMYAAFFLEAYINIYDYTVNSTSPDYAFEEFSKKPTSQKWESHFPLQLDFLKNIKDLFGFRNFLVHSKPIRRSGGKNEVFVKGRGWIPATETSSLVTNELGLFLENIPVKKLIEFKELINQSVDLIESKTPGFNGHYQLKIRSEEQFQLIEEANKSYKKLESQLKSVLKPG